MSIFFRTIRLPERIGPASGVVSDIWFEQNVTRNGERGVEIHTMFDIYGMRSKVGRICAFIHHERNGESVISEIQDGIFSTPQG
ncbi:MAG TPA: hypothetical protein ENN67_03830, partial [Firmicutes bacterium]|nr:hypothetical protein [Bacillota bacterium]